MATEFVDGPSGPLEIVRTGGGSPTTLFAHGLGASVPTTRPFGSGVDGTRVFMHFRSHGRSAAADSGWDYPHLAGELRTVADAVGAQRALGVSMGAGALLRVLLEDPDRFERVVLVIPAVIDEVRNDVDLRRYDLMAQASQEGRADVIREQLVHELPAAARGTQAASAWLEQQTEVFLRPGMAQALRDLPRALPVPDLSELARLRLPVLVLAQRGDPIHPVESAELLAEHLPDARLEVFDEFGLLWGHRARVRETVADFLNAGLHT